MKFLITILLSIISTTIYGQEVKTEFDGHTWQAPYYLPTPKEWGIERFLIPISFAPQIPYKGIEDIRFTPGWAKIKSDEYWSYAFLWYLDGEIVLNSKIIDSTLKKYYTGLLKSNTQNMLNEKAPPVQTSFKEIAHEKGDQKTFIGTVKMLDYIGKKPILLHCKVHLKSCFGESKTFIFYELSPQPLLHAVWNDLDNLWLDFKCIKD